MANDRTILSVGYGADIAGLERAFGRALTKLPDRVRRDARTTRADGRG